MKKTYLVYLFLIFLFVSCKTGGQDTPKNEVPKEALLEKIVIKQGDESVATFRAPIKKVRNVSLDKRISSKNFLSIEAFSNDANASIKFDNDSSPSSKKTYEKYIAKVAITVSNASGSNTYTLNITQPDIDQTLPLLQSLEVKQGKETLAKYTDPIEDENTVRLKKEVSTKDYILVEAKAKDIGATIHFDGRSQNEKTQVYATYRDKIVIEVKKSGKSSKYTLFIPEYEAPPKEDTSLASIFIKQGATQNWNFENPTTSLSVELPKKVSAIEAIEVEAKAKDSTTTIKIDGEGTSTKRYEAFKASVAIVVTKGESSTTYNISFAEPTLPTQNDSVLTKLKIKQKGVEIYSCDEPVPLNISASIPQKVEATNEVVIEATPKESGADVFFDRDATSNTTKTYTALKKRVSIVVKKGENATLYTVNLSEAIAPPPQSYTVKCNVVDSAGGTNVEDVEIKAYLKGKDVVLQTANTDAKGDAYFTLEAGKYYDFSLEKEGMAASRIESFFIHANKKEYLPIIMREWAVGSARIAPECTLSLSRDSQQDVADIYELDSNLSDNKIYITVRSKSGEIIPEELSDSNNYGLAANIGSPISTNSLGMVFPYIAKYSDGKHVHIGADGVVEQKFMLNFAHFTLEEGENTLYLSMYDTAGNRCERQQRLNVKNGGLKPSENFRNRISNFQASAKRFYRSLSTFEAGDENLFGMTEEEGVATTCKVEFLFKFKNVENIFRVDVLRRPYQMDDIDANWKLVYTKHYKEGYRGNDTGVFTLVDDSGTLKEGEVYQYKLEAYDKDGKMTSPIATVRIMEAFNVLLLSPSHGQKIAKADVQSQDFSFKISNHVLWDKKRSDYFSFDILVVDDMTKSGGKGKSAGVCFASKLRYYFDKTDDNVLKICGESGAYTKYSDFVSSGLKISDLVRYSAGVVTITNKYMNEGQVSLGKEALKDTVRKPSMYYWDIQDFGRDPLAHIFKYKYDDDAAYFAKEYPYLNSETGSDAGMGNAISYSYSNVKRVGGAINGRSLFIVTN